MWTYIAIALMILVLVAMLIVKKTMAASPMLQPVLFLCVALELGLVISVFYGQLSGGTASGALANAERREYAKGFATGEFLKAQAGGKKLLLISSSGSKTAKMYQAFLKGLKEKYGDAVLEDETKEKNVDTGESDGTISVDDIKEVLARPANAGVELIVFYGTVPASYNKLDTKAGMFFVDTGSADLRQVQKDLEGGRVLGVIVAMPTSKTNIKPSAPVEKDPVEAFKKRYILVDKANVKANEEYFK